MIVANQPLIGPAVSERPVSERTEAPNSNSQMWFAQPHHQEKQQDIAQRLANMIRVNADDVQTTGKIFSPDGRWLAQATPDLITDLQSWQIHKTLFGRECLPPAEENSEMISAVYPTGIAWKPDSSGFFYDRYLAYPGTHALYFHSINTDQSEDRCLFYRPEQPEWRYQPFVSPDGRWLAISIINGTACNQISLVDLDHNELGNPVPLIDRFVGRYDILDWRKKGEAHQLILRAIEPATPNSCLMAVDLSLANGQWETDNEQLRMERALNPPAHPSTIILPTTDLPLLDAVPLSNGWVAGYLDGGCAELCWIDGPDLRDHKQTIPLPGFGTVADLAADPQSGKVEFDYTDHIRPWQRFSWQPGEQRPTPLLRLTPSMITCKPDQFVTRHHGVTSFDGVVVPVFVTCRRDIELADRPTIINAYGGMGVSLTPRFSADSFAWLEMGGVFVTVCARGGAELGAEWHQAAVGVNKQRTFDDVLAVVGWLHSQGITSPGRTGLWGSSNGGLTAGACLTQAPKLFGAVVIEAGLLDMLNYHQLGQGADWLAEYGSPDVAEQRAVLSAYSPLHNIVSGTSYPATLITTSDHDPRVGEAHSYRFAQALQEAQAGPAPILLRIDEGAGHGDQLSTQQWVGSAIDRLAFFAIQLCL